MGLGLVDCDKLTLASQIDETFRGIFVSLTSIVLRNFALPLDTAETKFTCRYSTAGILGVLVELGQNSFTCPYFSFLSTFVAIGAKQTYDLTSRGTRCQPVPATFRTLGRMANCLTSCTWSQTHQRNLAVPQCHRSTG
jgi:hypothetical protein